MYLEKMSNKGDLEKKSFNKHKKNKLIAEMQVGKDGPGDIENISNSNDIVDLFKKAHKTNHAKYGDVYKESIDNIYNGLYWEIKKGNFIKILGIAKHLLTEYGVKAALRLDESHSADAILITEAINWSAKVIDDLFYILKPYCIVSTAAIGAKFGYGDDDAYYLFDKEVGSASFHCPYDEVYDILNSLKIDQDKLKWPHSWSGYPRQDEAFDTIENFVDRNADKSKDEYIKFMVEKTSPIENGEEPVLQIKYNNNKYSHKNECPVEEYFREKFFDNKGLKFKLGDELVRAAKIDQDNDFNLGKGDSKK